MGTTDQAQNEIEWFLKNLDLQLDDAALTREGVTFAFYWDTVDVRQAVLGMTAFYDAQSKFMKEEFRSPNALVTSLAAAKWVGAMQLLQPHQSEFLNLVSLEFELTGRSVPPGGLGQFLRDAGLQDSAADANLPIRELVDQQAGQADTLFKVVQAIGGTWETRLADWYKGGHLRLTGDSESDFDFDHALESPRFEKLRRYFDQNRRDYPINNLVDAMALCFLQHCLEKFKSDMIKHPLPRFFASTPLIRGVLGAINEEDFLTYSNAGDSHGVLRDADYYIFKATFDPPGHLRQHGPGLPPLEQLAPIAEELRHLVEKFGEVPQTVIERIRVDGRRMAELIDSLRRTSFLDQVWLPIAASDEFARAANEHIRIAHQLATDSAFVSAVRATIHDAVKTLSSNVGEYNWLTQLYFEFKKALLVRKRHHPPADMQALDVFTTYGLLRFGIPPPAHDGIQAALGMVLASDELTESAALAQLIRACRISSGLPAMNELPIALSALWVCELDHDIEMLLRRRGECLHRAEEPWVLVFRAAAIFRSGKSTSKGQSILENLRDVFEGESDPLRKSVLAVGIAYLYFHLWRCRGGDAPWRRFEPSRTAVLQGEMQDLIGAAIKHARYAYDHTGGEEKLRVYSLNQLLYYTVEGGTEEQFQEIRTVATELLAYKSGSSAWQYRFDDTLARYYHRLSLLADDPRKRSELIVLAQMHIKHAFDFSCGDAEVAQYKSILGNAA
jgi:hypothetical protein